MRRLGPTGGRRRPQVRLSGTLAVGARKQDVIDGGGTLVLSLSAARWHGDVGGNTAATTALLGGIVSMQSEVAGWNAVVSPGLTFADVTRDSDSVVTISLPAHVGYDLVASEVISVAVPGAALMGGEALAAVSFGVSAPVVAWAWSGGLRADGFAVVAGLEDAQGTMTLRVATDEAMESVVFESAAIASGVLASDGVPLNVGRFDVSGLQPDQIYFYAIATNGVVDRDYIGRVVTCGLPLIAADFRLVFGSCSDPGLSDPDGAFDAVEAAVPLVFVHMGDLHYESIANDDLARAREGIRRHLVLPKVASLYRHAPIAYTYDDHDFGPNDSHQGTASFASFAANSSTAYRDLVPHYPLAHPDGTGWTQGVAQAWTMGRVRFVMPDLRVHRSVNTSPGTVLGDGRTTGGFASWDQKQWLKDQFDQARNDGIKLVVLISSSVLLGPNANAWKSDADWVAELTEVLSYGAAPGMPELLVMCGDAHATAFDDGTNVDTVFGVSLAHIVASPLRNIGFAGTGPYSWRGVDSESNTQSQAFVVVDFHDDGGDRVIWTATPRGGNGATFGGVKGGPFSNADLGN